MKNLPRLEAGTLQTAAAALVPRDKLNLVFMIFLFNGIGTLFPWNILINADNYFVNYKLNVANATTTVEHYREGFLSYLGIASKVPNILLQIVNMFFASKSVNFSRRISWTLVMQIVIFLFIIACACVDSSSWPGLFFWLTLGSAAAINTANGVYQSCEYGAAARFPSGYTNAITAGMNISGTIASLLVIISILVSPSPQVQAIVFFSLAVVQLSICWGAEFYLRNNDFYRFYIERDCSKIVEQCTAIKESYSSQISFVSTGEKVELQQTHPPTESRYRSYLSVFKKIWIQLLNLILIYLVTFSLFPAVAARILPTDSFHYVHPEFFSPIFCFLFFNLFATLGNFTAYYWELPARHLIWLVLARAAFIPYFLLCNYQPSDQWARTLPVYFNQDWMYILGMMAMAWSAGYLSSLALMYIPRSVQPDLAATAGMQGALVIIVGILIGVNCSLLYPKIIS